MFGQNGMITEGGAQKWSQIIKEELGVTDSTRLNWMAKYAQNHEIYEGVQVGTNGVNAYPLNTLGMGNPMMPAGVGFNGTDGSGIGNTGADFHNPNYGVGSGDIPMSTLTMSLQLAATTVGFELVPVIPANGPWAMLSYMDFPYAGGKLGRINETSLDGKGAGDINKPIYIKFNYPGLAYKEGKNKYDLKPEHYIVLKGQNTGGDVKKALVTKFIGFSRIDNDIIVKVIGTSDKDDFSTDFTLSDSISIADVFGLEKLKIEIGTEKTAGQLLKGLTLNSDILQKADINGARVDLVAAAADHVQGFSNFFDGSDDPMTRAQNETGVGNTIGARMFTKMVQMGSYEVTGTVTRQQLQDMPLYGVDVVGSILEAMQNEISQAINNRILDRVFKLGVTNAKLQKEYQGLDLNLYFGATGTSKELKDFTGAHKFVDIHGNNVAKDWGPVYNATQNTAAENFTTHQRRIMSRLLAAANVITQVSRWGRPTWAVTNAQIVTALQDCAGYVVAPMNNTMAQDGTSSLYYSGSVAGLNIYVDPYMDWNDTRICVGRKSNGKNPGVIFMPYILADKIQIIAEGTMAPKMLINSRYCLVDLGFNCEQSFLTFLVDMSDGYII